MSQRVVSVSPFRCRVWALHDRIEDHITEDTCRSEIESFSSHGQLVPVLGRPLHGDVDHDVELICGARRLFVARLLNTALLVDLRDMSDIEAIVAMDIENRQRTDVSPYERGLAYATWLRAGHFHSQEELAKTLKISPSQVSRLLQLARLPAVVLSAFGSPSNIREVWGLALAELLSDATKRDAVINKARLLSHSSARLPAPDAYRHLISASESKRRSKHTTHDDVIKDNQGAPLFRIRHYRDSIAIVLSSVKVSASALQEIRNAVADILLESTAASGRLRGGPAVPLSARHTRAVPGG